MKKKLWIILFVCVSFVVYSEPDGQKRYAVEQSHFVLGNVIGRLEVLRHKITTNMKQFTVCIEKTAPTTYMTTEAMILETKLTIATWMSESGLYTSDDWGLIRFISKESCVDDPETAVFVLITNPDNPTHVFSNGLTFGEYTISNQCSSAQKVCVGGYATLAYSTFNGARRVWALDNPSIWKEVTYSKQDRIVMSPNVIWLSLDYIIYYNTQLKNAIKQALITEYQRLQALSNPTYKELTDFNDALASHSVLVAKPSYDVVFAKAYKSFPVSSTPITLPYKPYNAFYEILLHEMGHQMGLGHGHQPYYLDSTNHFLPDESQPMTGMAEGEVCSETQTSTAMYYKDVNGYCVTNKAVMSYDNLNYLFLMPDDVAGVQRAVKELRSHFKKM